MKTIFILSLISTFMVSCASETKKRGFDYIPRDGYAPTVDVDFVESSATQKLKPTQKIANLTKRNFDGEVILQKLTDNSYWFQSGFYNTTFYIGKKSVLVLDPLAYGKGVKIIKAIRSITNKPISTVVYSHHHEDHIGDIGAFVDEAKKSGFKLRIISTDETAKVMKRNHSKLPYATEVVSNKKNMTTFEDQVLKVIRYAPSAHSKDSVAWLLVKERIIHSPDIVNANQLPFLGFGGSETFHGYRENLLQLKQANWDYFSSGHGNIGSKKDIDFMIQYVDNLVKYVKESGVKVSFGKYFVKKYNNHQAAVHAYNIATEKYIMDKMRVKYGDMYGFEASVPYQIKMVKSSLH